MNRPPQALPAEGREPVDRGEVNSKSRSVDMIEDCQEGSVGSTA